MTQETAAVVNVIEKSRVEQDGSGRGPWKETWTEVEIQSMEDKISENMADFLWHEFGIEAEEKGLEVEE